MNFTTEQLMKAKSAKSAEALLAYAKEVGCALAEEEAQCFYDRWHKDAALADEELDDIVGAAAAAMFLPR